MSNFQITGGRTGLLSGFKVGGPILPHLPGISRAISYMSKVWFFDQFVNITSFQWNIYEIVQECPFSTQGICKCSEEKMRPVAPKAFFEDAAGDICSFFQCMLMLI